MKIVLLYSGNPVPAMLELGFAAVNAGKDVDLIIVDRGISDLHLDEDLVNYPVTRICSPYNGINLKRFMHFPLVAIQIAKRLFQTTRRDDVVITNTVDMLLIARLVSMIKPLRIRHQVRDLVSLQLERGILCSIFRLIDRWLVKGCEMLMYSAPAFYEKYYCKIYSGNTVLLENIPRREIWHNFKRNDRQHKEIKIGYIGIIRYMTPLRNLIDAVQILNNNNPDYSVLFAGGGDQEALRLHIKNSDYFSFLGRFEYTSSVAEIHSDIDLIFAVYDRNDQNCQIAMPTKFYESILTKIPILVSSNTYVGDLVERLGIGRAVDGESVDALVVTLSQIEESGSWYAKAKESLESFDAEKLFQDYDSAISIAIKDR